MNLRHKVISSLMAGAMVFGTTIPAFAEGDDHSQKPEITKTLEVADNVYYNFEFGFDLQFKSYNATDNNPDGETMPTGTQTNAEYRVSLERTTADGAAAAGDGITSGTTELLDGFTFPAPGKYTYTLTEDDYTGTDSEYVTKDTDTYTVNVYVTNGEDGFVYQYEVLNSEGSKANPAFENTYNPVVNVVVGKQLTGSFANADDKVTIDVEQGDKTVTSKSLGILSDTKFDTQSLGTYAAGSTVTVSENQTAQGYTPAYTVSGFGNNSNGDGASVENVVLAYNMADEDHTYTFNFTNTKEGTTPTGIIINNLPFIMLVVIGGAGIAFYMASKRRMNH